MAASELTGVNAAYVAQLLQDYIEAPGSVPPEWRALFEQNGAGALLNGLDGLAPPSPADPAPARADDGAEAPAPPVAPAATNGSVASPPVVPELAPVESQPV